MSGVTPQCPHCESIDLRRQARTGFVQKQIFSRMGYFPWECGQCRQIYLFKLRSAGYRARPERSAQATPVARVLLKDES